MIEFLALSLIEGTKVIDTSVSSEQQKLFTKEITEKSFDFINRNQSRPFFLYIAHPMVHVPLYVSDASAGKSGAALFADMVTEVD